MAENFQLKAQTDLQVRLAESKLAAKIEGENKEKDQKIALLKHIMDERFNEIEYLRNIVEKSADTKECKALK